MTRRTGSQPVLRSGKCSGRTGILEILRLQGLVRGTWTFDTHEQLSAGQSDALSRLSEQYPDLADDDFVAERLDEFLR